MFENKEELLNKICDCLFPVVKKYMIKIFLYPFLLIYGYKALKYLIAKDVDLTYSNVFSYVFMAFFILIVIESWNRLMSYEYRNDITKTVSDEFEPDERTLNIKAYHEAGHFFIAKFLGLPIKEVNIIENRNIGGQVLLDMPNILKASQIKKLVMVRYAGFLAEKLLNGEASDGCMGSDRSDMDSANILLRKYILLTDDISFTGYEDKYIKNKSIELSNLWKQEVENLLQENENQIREFAAELIEKKFLKIV